MNKKNHEAHYIGPKTTVEMTVNSKHQQSHSKATHTLYVIRSNPITSLCLIHAPITENGRTVNGSNNLDRPPQYGKRIFMPDRAYNIAQHSPSTAFVVITIYKYFLTNMNMYS